MTAVEESLHLHKFILAARSSYFRKKLSASPEAQTWRLPSAIPPQAFDTAIRYLYLGEVPRDLKSGPGTGFTESEVFTGIDKIAKYLEIEGLLDTIIDNADRRLTRQRRTAEVARGQAQLKDWLEQNVLKHKVVTSTSKANDVKWDRDNAVFADVLLRADEVPEEEDYGNEGEEKRPEGEEDGRTLPIGPAALEDEGGGSKTVDRKSVLYPCHRAMLLRSEFFNSMFSSPFREAHVSDYLNIIQVDCAPEVLEVVIRFLYTEESNMPADLAVDVLFAADMLFIEKLKTKAAVVISAAGSGKITQSEATKLRNKPKTKAGAEKEKENGKDEDNDDDDLDIYAIMRAAWLTRVQRLEEFAARYLAYQLEAHIDLPEFAELIQDSAARIQARQETDSIELVDDIRFYLGERFRLRFDDAGIEEMMGEQDQNGGNGGEAGGGGGENEITNGVDGLDISGNNTNTNSNAATAAVPSGPVVRTLDGQLATDEFESDAINYQVLMEKLDLLLEKLNLEA